MVQQEAGQKDADAGGLTGLLGPAPVLWDGAMGTILMAAGLSSGSPPDGWNLSRPETVRQAHEQYVAAGSKVVQSNTFGANRVRLKLAGMADELGAINAAGVRLAREAARGGCLVAGDLGPTGELLDPLGKLTEDVAMEAYREQASHLAAAGCDLFHIETQYSLAEAVTAIRGVKADPKAARLPLVVSMTYRAVRGGFYTEMGETLEACVEKLCAEGADMVGTNCTLDQDQMIPLAERLIPASPVPVLLQPNAGAPRVVGDSTCYDGSPASFVDAVTRFFALGALAVGGCCGTTPEFISAAAQAVTS